MNNETQFDRTSKPIKLFSRCYKKKGDWNWNRLRAEQVMEISKRCWRTSWPKQQLIGNIF
ncbi:UNVERIFIED_CONTAM: hypothetical protein Slati_2642000 [Sesamum latifolium]|uniref:Uncharacterized protein n=1 Tax=Sesamum latifolium TaxID=2727402 RepID=A0AAW2VU75_9LAMI